MADLIDNDPEIGSLNSHLNGEPSQAIFITQARNRYQNERADYDATFLRVED